jgi:hypothetical protein
MHLRVHATFSSFQTLRRCVRPTQEVSLLPTQRRNAHNVPERRKPGIQKEAFEGKGSTLTSDTFWNVVLLCWVVLVLTQREPVRNHPVSDMPNLTQVRPNLRDNGLILTPKAFQPVAGVAKHYPGSCVLNGPYPGGV